MARALRVPFGEIGDMTRKQAITLNLFRLSSTSASLPTLTTNFEQAERFGIALKSVRSPTKGVQLPSLSKTFSGYPSEHAVREDAFGRWEAMPLPDGLTLDQVLARVVSVNAFCRDDRKNLLLKIKIRFSDSSEITFVRANVHDPKTLVYDSYYNPNAHFDAATHRGGAGQSLDTAAGLKSSSAAFVKKGAIPVSTTRVTLSALDFPKREVIHALFDRFDPNGNGVLSLAELDKAVGELWPQYNNKKAIMRAYKAADSNGSGVISKVEFHAFLRFLVNYNTVWQAFDGADRSRDHRLDMNEFANAVRVFEPGKSERELRDLFVRMDTNHGGYVLFDEFAAFVAASRSNVIQPTNIKLSLPRIGQLQPKTAPAAAKRAAGIVPQRNLVVPTGDKLAELFDRLDPNANGMLSLAELDKGVVELYPSFNNKPAIMRAYKAADRNGTGWVSKGEFPFFLHYLVHYTNLWHSFATIDASGDRRVSLQEFLAAAPTFGIRSETEARAAFAAMDVNCGGFVLFEEFADYMARTRAEFEVKKFDGRSGAIKRGVKKIKTISKIRAFELPPNTTVAQLFDRLDPNGNGMLSLAELDKGVVELFPGFNNKPALMRAYKAADRNGTGWVSKSEFPFFLRFLVHYTNLFHAFQVSDRDGDRRVSAEEFVAGAAVVGLKKSKDELLRLFSQMDVNQGGYVLFDEYAAALAQLGAA